MADKKNGHAVLSSNGKTELGYSASESTNQRRLPSSRLYSSDNLLSPVKRKRMIANARDLNQNFSIAAWAIRRHLDYTSDFTFQPQTGDAELNASLANLMRWYSRPRNCDAAGRHSMSDMIRLAEMRRTIDGDVFMVKLSDGRLQAIEADRIRDPDRITNKSDKWVQGVRVNRAGRALSYSVSMRNDDGTYKTERSVTARNMLQLGYYDRFDQVRGITPLAPAINSLRDCYESFDYQLAKSKISAMFGLVLTRDAVDGWGEVSGDATNGYDINLSNGKPVLLDLDPGDKAEFIESQSPSSNFQEFTKTMISVSLKALDIPYSFYDEGYTNFFGSRSAFIHYDKSVKQKREQLVDLLDQITAWRLSLFIEDGTLRLPAGFTVNNLRWEWVAAGTPWWNPSQEINADIAAINAGLKTRAQVIREHQGREFTEVINQLADEEAYIKEQQVGVVLQPPNELPGETPERVEGVEVEEDITE